MSTIAEVELPATEFALAETLDAIPDAEFEVVRVAAHDWDRIIPYVRVIGSDADAVTAALEADASVESVTLLDDLDDEQLYRMDWVDHVQVVAHVILEQGGTVLDMYGSDHCWYLRILFPDRDALSATHQFCTDEELTFEIRRFYELDESVGRGEYGLTEEQYDVLTTAVRRGYFDVPRERTMAELADELGISHQALSERLRRAHKNLITSALRIQPTEEGDLGSVHAESNGNG